MSIIVNENTRLLIQGITGNAGRFHSKAMKEFGTRVVAGVSPGHNGEFINGVPVFHNVSVAVSELQVNTSIIFVPAKEVYPAVMEAIENEIETIVIVTEHIPVHDAMKFLAYAEKKGVRILGPNCPGVCSPGKSLVGIMSPTIFGKGATGVVSRSGTLTYEVVNSLTESGFGQSTVMGLGGDRIIGSGFTETLEFFENDSVTKRVVMIGEIGGSAEEIAANYVKEMSKPVYAYIAGRTAPLGKRMGHAGAIISGASGTAKSKMAALSKAGAVVAKVPSRIPFLIKENE